MKKSSKNRIVDIPNILLFSLTVFLGAFLLFQVQPIIGKYILPWFGGSSSVWTTAILFFELVLLFGYFYAYMLTKLSVKRQIFFHATVLSLIAMLLIPLFFFWHSPITPPLYFKPADSIPPVVQVLMILLLSVGLPYFILSTTSSLLQRWFSIVNRGKSPYRLYALSNAGSLIGILSYPFLIEILLPIRLQGVVWGVGFVIYAVLMLSIARMVALRGKSIKTPSTTKVTKHEGYSLANNYAVWVVLPILSSVILLATTNKITQGVAPVPFLWLVPLGLYLVSFILAFDSPRWYWRWLYPYAFIASAVGAIWITIDLQSVGTNFAIYLMFLFTSFMLLHGELYRSRPVPEKLNLYYFLIALGGAIGGAIVAIVAPNVFPDFWEFQLGIFLAAAVAVTVIASHIRYILEKVPSGLRFEKVIIPAFYFLATASLFGGVYYYFSTHAVEKNLVMQSRNFYGTIGINRESDENGDYLLLYNGDITHGSQYLSERIRTRPTQYYGTNSGAGLAIYGHRKRVHEVNGLRIGVVGLGVGTLATYGREGEEVAFYEINPEVVDVAYDYFNYLGDSRADVAIVIGDARLEMEKEVQAGKEPYDVLLIDAFTDDAIPVHLLTKEAFGTYLSLLENESGILGIHISNRYLDLFPVVQRIADEYGLTYALIESDGADYQVSSATWVLLSENQEALSDTLIQTAKSEEEDVRQVDLWTDDYSNLFQVLDF